MQNAPLLAEWDVVHQPGVNEELAATAVHGSQLVPGQDDRTVDGVTGYWYGKSPGLDRAADALRHGNLAGAHHAGGAVVLVGDDPAAKSSTVPGASEFLLADLGMPILYPMDSQDVLDLGAHAVWMSRTSGLWVSVKVATAVADGSGSVTLAELEEPTYPEVTFRGAPFAHVPSGKFLQPLLADMETTRNGVRLDAARAYARANGLNRQSGAEAGRRVGIIAPGKTYLDVCQALDDIGLDPGGPATRRALPPAPADDPPAGPRRDPSVLRAASTWSSWSRRSGASSRRRCGTSCSTCPSVRWSSASSTARTRP